MFNCPKIWITTNDNPAMWGRNSIQYDALQRRIREFATVEYMDVVL